MTGIRIACALVLAAFAAFAIFLGVLGLQMERERAAWRPVPAVIDSARVAYPQRKLIGGRGGHRRFKVGVSYRYVVDGRTYTGNDYGDGNHWLLEWSAKRAAAALKPGSTTTCYVNPVHPGQSKLHNEGTWMVPGCFGFAGVCLLMIWVVAGAPGLSFLRSLRSRRDAACAS